MLHLNIVTHIETIFLRGYKDAREVFTEVSDNLSSSKKYQGEEICWGFILHAQ